MNVEQKNADLEETSVNGLSAEPMSTQAVEPKEARVGDSERKVVLERLVEWLRQDAKPSRIAAEIYAPKVWREPWQLPTEELDIGWRLYTSTIDDTHHFELNVGSVAEEKNLLDATFDMNSGAIVLADFSDSQLGDVALFYESSELVQKFDFSGTPTATEFWQERIARQRLDGFILDLCKHWGVDTQQPVRDVP